MVELNSKDATNFCMSGGIYLMVNVRKNTKVNTSDLMTALDDQLDMDHPHKGSYVLWQDDRNRTVDEVLFLIASAAARLRSESKTS